MINFYYSDSFVVSFKQNKPLLRANLMVAQLKGDGYNKVMVHVDEGNSPALDTFK